MMEKFYEEILGANEEKAHKFDAIEIHGVSNLLEAGDPNGPVFETDEDTPELYTVNAHYAPDQESDGIECIGDFPEIADAERYANELASRHNWTVYTYV